MLSVVRKVRSRIDIPLVLLAHPFEYVLALILVTNGLRAIAGDITPSLMDVNEMLRDLYFFVSTLGGLALIAGLSMSANQYNERNFKAPIGLGVAIERASLFIVAASYAFLATMILGNNFGRGLGYAIVLLFVAFGCMLRTVAIRRTTRATVRATQDWQKRK